jgi:hypothetical protein
MGSAGGFSTPNPPSVGKTSDRAIQYQINQLPKILAAQEKYGGKFTEAELNLLKEYGPQFANLQQEMAGITSPQSIAAQKLLTEEFQRPVEELLTPGEAQQFRADSRAATSARGLGESGFGALEEINALTQLRQSLKMQRLNLALGSTGGLPQASSFTQQGQISPGQLVQNVTPSQIFGLASSNYSTQAGAAASRYGATMGMVGDFFKGAGQALS